MMPAPECWLNLAGPDVLRCIPESGLDVILSPGRLGLLEQGRDTIDKVWFCILVAVCLQTAWLSPPVALSGVVAAGSAATVAEERRPGPQGVALASRRPANRLS